MSIHHLPQREVYKRVTDDVLRPMTFYTKAWFIGLAICIMLIGVGAISWAYQLRTGMGVAGYSHPIFWAIYITNFVWWIGIAHSGTLISAFLFLFRAPFRAAFSRATEAMTLFAVMTAGLFPILHLGRAWRAYWLIPYPNERQLWINFRSALVLDVFAVSTYFTVSVLFFWVGLIPDLATIRDRSHGWRRTVYGILSVGWEGTSKQWKHYMMAYAILAGLAAPLVVSVHSVVSWDFASGIVPGWHSTIFPPYFVAGAILSGLAMVITLMIPMRKYLRLEEYITIERLDALSRLTLVMGLVVSYAYLNEYFLTWFSQEDSELVNLKYKAFGAFAPYFWIMTFCNMVAPLALFWKSVRRSLKGLFIISILINIGMWMERFVIIVGSLARDWIPGAWQEGAYRMTWVEWGITIGSLGWFMFFFLLFTKLLPVLPIAEVKRDILLEYREEKAIEAAEEAIAAGGSSGAREAAS